MPKETKHGDITVVEVNPDLLLVKYPWDSGLTRIPTRIVRSDDKKKWWAHPPGGGRHWHRSKKGIVERVVARYQTALDFVRSTVERSK